MLEILAIAIPVAVTGLGGYIHLWVKAATTDQHVKDLIELINHRFDDSDRRLERIERSMNGHLKV